MPLMHWVSLASCATLRKQACCLGDCRMSAGPAHAREFKILIRESTGGPVLNLVAFSTKRDQVGLRVVTKGAAASHVVNVETLGASTYLTAPTITLQDFSMQPRI